MKFKRITRPAIWALSLMLIATSAVRADYVTKSMSFDLSDSLPGSSFGSVFLEAYDGVGDSGGGLAAGQVRMTFTPTALPVYGPTDASFGIQQLGFNSKLPLSDAQIQVPTGWKLRNDRFMGGFGKFKWQAYGDPSVLPGPLTLTINDLGAFANLDNFLVGSTNSAGDWPLFGSVYFAARIGGFDLNDDFFDMTSHVAGVSAAPPIIIDDPDIEEPPPATEGPPSATPEPTSLVLGLCGIGAIGLRRWWVSRTSRGVRSPS
jgi:hypothetical protein